MRFSKQAVLERYSFLGDNPLVRQYHEGSGFLNFGLWEADVKDQVAASKRLVDKLVAKLNKNGRIIDVGCGEGATTSRLFKFWDPSNVVAINMSEPQLEAARGNAPGSALYKMDASQLGFCDNSFEDIICVEAAMHFDTRLDFLKEAFRVLKPGGRIALTDLLMPRWAWYLSSRVPSANWVAEAAAYEKLMKSAGFKAVEIRDISDQSLKSFFFNVGRFVDKVSKQKKLGFGQKLRVKTFWRIQQRAFKEYLLVFAEK